ncbi:MAG: hypothetical protein K1X56_00820 [Flavobacteriales bacterium]|nr:hypothetical protein [Flavobacteriales bacterium]
MNQVFKQASFIQRVLVLSMLLSVIATHHVWFSYSIDFPKIPLIPFLKFQFSEMIQMVLVVVMMASLLGLFIRVYSKIFLSLFLVSTLLLLAEDVNRLQPWLFIHGVMIVALAMLHDKGLNLLRWGLVFMYAWAGINKLNLNFAWEVFPYFMKPFGVNEMFYHPSGDIGKYSMNGINHIAWIVPLVELLIALFLLLEKWRTQGVLLALILHVIALYILGPFGHNWNSVVWIWNVELMLLVVGLFYQFKMPWSEFKAGLFNSKMGRAYFLLMGLAPLLWYFSIYPHVLSYHLYSGYNPQINFWFNDESSVKLKDEGDRITNIDFKGVSPKLLDTPWMDFTFYDVDRNESFIMADHYAMQELNVPIMAETFYFKMLGAELCTCFGYAGDDAGIRIEERSKFSAKIIERTITCKELLGK